jgi:hypothetical protein
MEMNKMETEFYTECVYDERHGGPYDRGSADSYYDRDFDPHYYIAGSYCGNRIELKDMTVEEIVAYTAGYRDNEASGNKKDWGSI